MTYALLRAVLIARCVASVALAGVLSATDPSHLALIRPFAAFAVVDGVLALAMAALALGAPVLRGGVAWITALDGLLLIATGTAIWLGPGIPHRAVTLVLYLGLAAVFSFFVGLLKLMEARRLHGRIGRNMVSVSLSIAGLGSAAVGVAAFVMHPGPARVWWLLMAGALIEGFALLAVALRKWPRAPGDLATA
jgi:hypothetical protein